MLKRIKIKSKTKLEQFLKRNKAQNSNKPLKPPTKKLKIKLFARELYAHLHKILHEKPYSINSLRKCGQ